LVIRKKNQDCLHSQEDNSPNPRVPESAIHPQNQNVHEEKNVEYSDREQDSDITPYFNPGDLPSVKMTAQFSLRPINGNTIEDEGDTLSMVLSFDKETIEFMPDFTGLHSRENIIAYLANSVMTQSMGISFTYIIRFNAGICGLIKVTSPSHNRITNNFNHWLIDYILIPPFRGHKVMKSALPIVFDIMKNRLGITDPIYAMVLPGNDISIHLLSLNGFIKDTSLVMPVDPKTGKESLIYRKDF